jgi:hypothetical protein
MPQLLSHCIYMTAWNPIQRGWIGQGTLKGGSITVLLTYCLTVLNQLYDN